MKNQRRAIVVVAAAAALAGTSGAALAAVGSPQAASRTVNKSTRQVSLRPAIKVTGQTDGGIVGAQADNSVVREPGSLTVTVEGQQTATVACITDVRAWVYSGSAVVAPATSALDTSKIKLAPFPKVTHFTLHVPFSKKAATGTWYLASVTGVACGTKGNPWNAEWDGYDSFTVR
jgi:hypothetical protein